ncbi:MAG: 1-acyl-sn-glycerol-3-phosphate acyltransferase [Deltaproteobacteria bacterium]|jgi:1-acyl-sn-glycerol-3-phosphate acyltransferase|nr:1-acyl-sn-glycerol-3-phosphate acyltransferase [Deltaproteobacteria bacterium]
MLPDDPFFTSPGEYHTPPGRAGRLARRFPRLFFYPLLWKYIAEGAYTAIRGRYDDAYWALNSLQVLRALEYIGCRFHVEGLEHITELQGPCVFVGNHMSALETLILPGLIAPRKRATFVVKRSLTTAFAFGHLMRSRDPVVVDRKNPRDDLAAMLNGSAERLGRGISMIVFPQATRSPHFDREQFNSIGVKVAGRNKAPLIPLALKTDAWGCGDTGVLKDYGKISPDLPVRFRFGKALRVEGNGREEQERLCRFIEDALTEWRA